MIRRALSILILVAAVAPAAAGEPVTVATIRLTENGALFLAATRGYFKAQGIDLAMRAYPNPRAVVQALAAGDADFGLAGFTATAFDLAGQGKIKAIAAQVREHAGYEDNEIVASDLAYSRGLRKLGDLVARQVAVTELGSNFHYQLGQIVRVHRFDAANVTLKAMHSYEAVMNAVARNRADAAILPAAYAHELLLAGRAHLVGWYSEVDAQQLGALFGSADTLRKRHAIVNRLLSAYRRGAADYVAALMRHDSAAEKAAAEIARYVRPAQTVERPTRAVEDEAYFMDAQAGLDFADVARQVGGTRRRV